MTRFYGAMTNPSRGKPIVIPMIAFWAQWAFWSAIPVILAIVCATSAPRKEWSIAILCSMTAGLPGLAVLIARLFGSSLFTPAQIGIALAVAWLPVVVSYYKVPSRAWPRRWEILRVAHIVELLMWSALLVIADMVSA